MNFNLNLYIFEVQVLFTSKISCFLKTLLLTNLPKINNFTKLSTDKVEHFYFIT